ncbi:DUF5671 domain-containing protein [Roseivivax sediminis]|uniref:DUF5671 domain-containing protein n=1 Tax=Roseivivax sediminis TaxID=936889 RepID=A0A1I2C0Z7_9RHOB|nr:DUF5671 domain-containing protein [Roseivivax sediminis]SFE62116.1 hypothetical protein SAMN04515678_11271 [Roseivivax sediminis]
MRASQRLTAFVAEALRAGHSHTEVAGALTAAGWSRGEANKALADWAEGPFPIPVPRPRPAVSAREAFVYGLMFVALAVSVIQGLSLGFEVIDLWLDPPPEDRPDYVRRALHREIASVIVFFPIFLVLNARVARAARADGLVRRSAVRDWLAHIAMFVAALTVVIDLVSVLAASLGGGADPAFLVKSALVAVVAAAVFVYFRGFTRDPGAAS